jgi:3-oxoacyl-[acyl-carrier protein] reductase
MDALTLGMPPAGLRGKVAIVTGVSRHQGIGAAICRAFASCGVDIVFTHWQAFDRETAYGADEDGPALIELELGNQGIRVESLEVDLSSSDAPRQILGVTVERLGMPSILVNNAAHDSPGGILELDASVLDRHYAVNVRGMVLLCAEFVRRYPGGPGGRIINLSSGQALTPMPQSLAYATTKGAVEAFTFFLAVEVASKGITVNAVDPGGTDTGWMTEELRSDLTRQMGMGRVGQPEDAARLITFLASEAGGWITGQVIHSRGA